MSKSNALRIAIFKKYGFMIDAPVKILNKIDSLPNINKNVTFKTWKKNVFGSSDIDVFVYEIFEPSPLTRISTLKINSGTSLVKSMLHYFSNKNEIENKKSIDRYISDISERYEKKYEKFDKIILTDLLNRIGDELEQPVRDFIIRKCETKNNYIDAAEMLTELILLHNKTVHRLRALTKFADQGTSSE